MADGKKTFIFYSDWINMINEMPDKDAGELLKHILRYVNDENPTTDNLLVKMAFGHMKPMLKSDLKKWDTQLQRFSDMGKKSAKKRALNRSQPTLTHVEPTSTVNDNVNVNVNVNDNIKKENRFNFRKSLVDYGFDENLVNDWITVRKTKKASNTKTAYNGFIKQVELCKMPINEILTECVNRSWGGLKAEWLETKIHTLTVKSQKMSASQIIQQVKNGTYGK